MNPNWLLLLLAAGLAGVIGLELRGQPRDDIAMPARAPRPTPQAAPATPGTQAVDRAAVAAILARPLFAPDRRPAAPPAAAAPQRPLPRIAGILIDGPRRSVIFAAAEGARPQVLAEGAEIAGFHIQRIEPHQVTLAGPEGPRTLRPSFDPSPPAAASAAPAPPNLQGLIGIPGLATPPGGGLPALPGLPLPPGAPPVAAPAAR